MPIKLYTFWKTIQIGMANNEVASLSWIQPIFLLIPGNQKMDLA